MSISDENWRALHFRWDNIIISNLCNKHTAFLFWLLESSICGGVDGLVGGTKISNAC